jgi:hypothetical protein
MGSVIIRKTEQLFPKKNKESDFGVISHRAHRTADDIVGSLLLVSTLVLPLGRSREALAIFLIASLVLLIRNRIPSRPSTPKTSHLMTDISLGLILMVAPTVFGYELQLTRLEYAWHFMLGLTQIANVALLRRPQGRFHSPK